MQERHRKNNKCEQLYNELMPNLADYVGKFARCKGKEIALIEVDTGEEVLWKDFDKAVTAFSAKLLFLGLRKGDVLATSLPLLKEHIFLIYACYRIGIIIAPLDLRLKTEEVISSLKQINPKAYFFLGKTPVVDFRPMVREVMANVSSIQHWIQVQKEKELLLPGVTGILDFAADLKKRFLFNLFSRQVTSARQMVKRRDPALIIFTTGSTGFPKPALLCHENILVQNIGLYVNFEMRETDRMLVNLPPSHVGCITEQLATTIYGGGTAVILHIFKPDLSLEAIQKYAVTVLGQIPALFAMQWRLPRYNNYDLSSLRFALYGGQTVSKQFLVQLSQMAPQFGSGLGLTETAGFCTYTPLDGTVDDILAGIGFDMPLCPISIREPMNDEGAAGNEIPQGEVGEICFSGPQIFLGYLNDNASTDQTISSDGYCYTGDLGFYDEKGLHFSGRRKLVIKPKGYQVFPSEVENFIEKELSDKISSAACVGVPHEVFGEAIIAFVEKKTSEELVPEEVHRVCKNLTAYKRPLRIIILEQEGIPLNRVAKKDYLQLQKQALEEITRLRSQGKWDVE